MPCGASRATAPCCPGRRFPGGDQAACRPPLRQMDTKREGLSLCRIPCGVLCLVVFKDAHPTRGDMGKDACSFILVVAESPEKAYCLGKGLLFCASGLFCIFLAIFGFFSALLENFGHCWPFSLLLVAYVFDHSCHFLGDFGHVWQEQSEVTKDDQKWQRQPEAARSTKSDQK